MLRYCPNCFRWEINRNSSSDPIQCWREISDEQKDKIVQDWHDLGKVL